MLLALSIPVFADTELKGNARYDCSISEDGKTAKVVVTLSDYYTANSIMIVPEFDSDNLTLKRGRWLIEGVLAVNWNAEYGDAVIAFSNATDINTAVFEMTFAINGDVKALDNVSCDIIAKTVEKPPAKDSETDAHQNQYVEPATPTPEETEYVETSLPETEPVETKTPETEPVETEPDVTEAMETFLPETELTATEPSASEDEATEIQDTKAEVTEPQESEPEVTKPSANYPNYGDYITQSDYEKNKDDTNLVPVFIVAGIAVIGVCVAVVAVTRKNK